MRKLTVFNNISLDGYFVDSSGDMSWAHNNTPDAEWSAFVEGNAQGGGILLFGRITYELMANFSPTPAARAMNSVVADRMNNLQKVVFSRTLEQVSWNNTQLVKSDIVTAVRTMKAEPGADMVILGSGSIVAQLAQAGLIDEFQLVVNPIVLGSGRTLFAGIGNKLSLRRVQARSFANGNVLLCYEPVA